MVLIAAIAAFIVAALHGPRWWRAASFGAATAVTAAYSAALTKAITSYTNEGWGHVFTHFQPYMLAITGLGTVFLIQNALHAGPITASRTTMVTINPLVSIVLGITLFADRLRSGPFWVSPESWPSACWWPAWSSWPGRLWWPAPRARAPGEMLGGARRRTVDTPGSDSGVPGVPVVPGVAALPRPAPDGRAQAVNDPLRPWTAGASPDVPGHVEPPASCRRPAIPRVASPSSARIDRKSAAVTRASPSAPWWSSQERPKR